jgi:hypothetical protein
MVGLGRTLFAAVFATALIARSATAQVGSSSVVHTVSVTVPPRVKVQLGSFAPEAPAVKVGNLNSSTQGLSVSVNATQAWTLSIASADSAQSSIRWSRDASLGYTGLTSSQVTIASGVLSNQPKAANVFFRAAASDYKSDSATTVLLTVSAP